MGESPPSSQRCRWEHKTDSGFGVRCSGTRGVLRLDHVFAYAKPLSSWPLPWAEFLTLAPGIVSSAYLRLLIFLLAILIPACASSSLAFWMMYYVDKLNKQCDNIQPWCTPFPIWNQSTVPYLVLTVASWPTYRFLKRQVRWSGIPISLRIFHTDDSKYPLPTT